MADIGFIFILPVNASLRKLEHYQLIVFYFYSYIYFQGIIMFNFITVSLFVAVLATSFNPQMFQSFLLKKQLAPATVEKVGKKADVSAENGMINAAAALASNNDMVKMVMLSSAKELRQRHTKD
jgi:hypothetical protein